AGHRSGAGFPLRSGYHSAGGSAPLTVSPHASTRPGPPPADRAACPRRAAIHRRGEPVKRFLALAAAVALLAGCDAPPGVAPAPAAPPSGQAPSGSPPPAVDESGGHNATDVMFLQMMGAQYAPAGELLKLADQRSRNEKVRQLAAAMNVTQADELSAVQGWLQGWQQPLTPDADPDLHAGHGGLPATGPAEIRALREAADADFDRVLLNLLIGHQHQAIEYARMELTAGANPQVLEFATRVDASRTAQVSMMLGLVSG
ncbi:DUF305 domain-containing protein, partial [Catellatospora sp. NPDC049609]|uniref:DUF305 domain-containing protein n=1 Tax=Catellatospora sp. NPDC049609 TaxID=3155505 RepID=UPI003422C59B